MPDESDSHEFSESEMTAMRYAYRQLLGEHPERFPTFKDKQKLAKSVINSLEFIRASLAKDIEEAVNLIMEGDHI